MGESESFLARWSRLKQTSGARSQPRASHADPPPPAAEPSVAAASLADDQASSGPSALDPADLPALGSITAGSRMEQFLQAGVPAELTRAALRAAWVADPATRDFVGIADSQWDFNDPTAMPGFGPLEATDGAREFAERTVARINWRPERSAGTAGAATHSAAHADHRPREGQVDPVWLSHGGRESPLPQPAAERPPQKQEDGVPEGANASDADGERAPGARGHGSALPKWVR
jgi:hypothetical protein